MKGDILIFNMRYCSLLFTKKLQRYGMINRPSLDQPLYLDISRYLDIFHLDTGYLNISVSKYLFLLYSLPILQVRVREPLRDVRGVHVRDGDARLRHPLLEEEGALRPHHAHRHGRGWYQRQQRLVQVGVPRRWAQSRQINSVIQNFMHWSQIIG